MQRSEPELRDRGKYAPLASHRNPGAATPAALRWAMWAAVAITAVIAVASFVLSFAALWDLATMAGLPRQLSWLWPVIVDGTILQATISVIAVSAVENERRGQRFFWAVLAAAAAVSVSANALHATLAGEGVLPPALAATIATVAPVSLLATTHGLAILMRINSDRLGPLIAGAPPQMTFGAHADPVDAGDWPDWRELASSMRDRELTARPVVEVAEILKLRFEEGLSQRKIARHVDIHHSTVGRVIDGARALLPVNSFAAT